MKPIIETANLTKTYGSNGVAVHALRGIDLTVERGEFLALIGPSGSGKSTLMSILGCLDTPTSGTYSLEGERVEGLSGRAIALREKVGIPEKAHVLPSKLSGGQTQRVAVARALGNHPAMLLADEPTGALDSKTGHEVLELFTELHKQGNTILIVTHDLSIAALAERQVEIQDGVILHAEAA